MIVSTPRIPASSSPLIASRGRPFPWCSDASALCYIHYPWPRSREVFFSSWLTSTASTGSLTIVSAQPMIGLGSTSVSMTHSASGPEQRHSFSLRSSALATPSTQPALPVSWKQASHWHSPRRSPSPLCRASLKPGFPYPF